MATSRNVKLPEKKYQVGYVRHDNKKEASKVEIVDLEANGFYINSNGDLILWQFRSTNPIISFASGTWRTIVDTQYIELTL